MTARRSKLSLRASFQVGWRPLVILTVLTIPVGLDSSVAAERSAPSSAAASPTENTCPAHTKPIRLLKEGERGFVALSDYVAFRYPARIGLLATTCVSLTRTSRYLLAIESRRHTIAVDPNTFPLDLRGLEFTPLTTPQGHP